MCRTCGCSHDLFQPATSHRITLETALLAKNDRLADELRNRYRRDGITTLNFIGSPGAGKTTLLEHTIRALRVDVQVTVLEGDQATDCDARRIAATGCRVVQINTESGCHLDASMVQRGLASLAPPPGSLLFVENVGNLVCPALFDLGEHAKVVVMSVTEGEDKPLEYPHVFDAARVLVLTKTDLLPHLDVNRDRIIANARRINPGLDVFEVAAPRGDGLREWCSWLRASAGAAA